MMRQFARPSRCTRLSRQLRCAHGGGGSSGGAGGQWGRGVLLAATGGACGFLWLSDGVRAEGLQGSAQQAVIAAEHAHKALTAWRRRRGAEPDDDDDAAELPVISLDEVRKHKAAGSLWVTYHGEVYDVTEFASIHPGGHDLLLTAGGLDLDHFFHAYAVHLRSDKAFNYLKGYKIGRLSPEDAARSEKETTTRMRLQQRAVWSRRSHWRLGLVMATVPLWIVLRLVLRVVAFVLPPIGRGLAALLPISVPGVGGAAQLALPKDGEKPARVAVIGGGIAGSSAAFALKESGFDVELYEAREQLGGNAKTFEWTKDGKVAKSGLAVLAWPPEYFKNYGALLEKLGVAVSSVKLPFFIRSTVPGKEGDFGQVDENIQPSLRAHFEEDFKRWDRMVSLVRKVNDWFNGVKPNDAPSAYHMSFLNPMNMIPMNTLWRWCGGSREFWDIILVSLYDSTFLTTQLDSVPSVVAPMMDDIIPLNRCSQLNSWTSGNSQEVFLGMTKGCTVSTDTRVLSVTEGEKGLAVSDDRGRTQYFDRVIFACQAAAVANILRPASSWVEDTLLRAVQYTDDNEPGWLNPTVHSDSGILPAEQRSSILRDYANYIEVGSRDGGRTYDYENSFVLNWTPSTSAFGDDAPAMLVTHDLSPHKNIAPEHVRGTTSHARAHPDLTTMNLMITQMLPMIQGRRGVYYCCNYTTPANGHDLSLLSGFSAAWSAGARYPFPANVEAEADFKRMKGLMGL
eukprot:TRINITY_DN35781_c0_g1_i1.p1 TRINITY_DN35781_c0_g1~~TRINITY_DN35781_c0_g1_i1.p1  ORF type:complete len:737 (+),score=243.06 TRINITY_DN35781_c0_g1_i1:90-2300(+)